MKEKFGWKRFRVLVLTSSQKRIENMQQAARELPSGHGLFLFSTHEQLQEQDDALSLSWQIATSDKTVLLRDRFLHKSDYLTHGEIRVVEFFRL